MAWMLTLQWTQPESFLNLVTLSSHWVSDGKCTTTYKCINMFPAIGGACKTTVGYSDEIINICDGGLGFKIRRQWRITNWCTNKDTVCVQYIKVEDKEAPIVGSVDDITAFTGPHDCYTSVTLPVRKVDDCSGYDQTYTMTIYDPATGRPTVLAGSLPL